MSKIVCDICGTTYPETATQCPICGSARPADADAIELPAGSGSYTYVKGGRFSKANVRKRNNGAAQKKSAAQEKKPAKKQEPAPQRKEKSGGGDSNRGLIITAIVLLVAVIAVVGYIAVKYFFVPENEGAANVKDTIPCVSVSVSETEVELDLASDTKTASLKVTTMPTNTTDGISYASDNAAVATIDTNGVVTAVGVGTAKITISCGKVSTTVEITVKDSNAIKPEDLDLSFIFPTHKMEMAGEESLLYVKEKYGVDPSEITWSTDNAEVATIVDGKVTAVANGVTTVYGEYKGVKFSCIITVVIGGDDDDNNGGNGVGEDNGGNGVGEDNGGNGVGEDNGGNGVGEDDNNTTPASGIAIYAVWGDKLEDISMASGESLTLIVKTTDGETVNATFTVSNDTVCSVSGDTITRIGSGETTLTATYNGLTAQCLVRCY